VAPPTAPYSQGRIAATVLVLTDARYLGVWRTACERLPSKVMLQLGARLQPMAAVENRVGDVLRKVTSGYLLRYHSQSYLPGLGTNVTPRSPRPCSKSCSSSSSTPSYRPPVVDVFKGPPSTERVVISNSRLRAHSGCYFSTGVMAIQSPCQHCCPGGTYLGKPVHQPVEPRA
jgi:hypothetical protein